MGTHKGSRNSTGVTLKLANAILKDVGGPRAKLLRGKIVSSDWDGIVNQPLPVPDEYDSPYAFARDYQAYHLLRKYPEFDLGIDRRMVALESFFASEESCRRINRYNGYIPYTFDSDEVPLTRTLEVIISIAREKIKSVLGPFSWNDAAAAWRFSGGASTRLRRASGHLYYKLQGKPHVTRKAALLGLCAIWHDEGWRSYFQSIHGVESDPCSWIEVVHGSKYTTVPKTAKTDRGICIEPELNMLLQLGIGSVIRRRLKSVRIDLNDQTWNQYLAKCGSGTGSLATIDLKSASDSISLELVRTLVPSDWFEAIAMTRSEYTDIDGTFVRLEKVSSMGNGYTFELESLIFWAISSAVLQVEGCSDTRLGVYGDDIVIHHAVAPRLVAVLSNLGFETNDEKTFLHGPFRESCGKHYFHGVDVSPFSITKPVDGPNRSFLHWNHCNNWFIPLRDACRYIEKYHLSRHRYYVPWYESPEAGMIVPLDRACPRWDKESQQWCYVKLQPSRRRHKPQGYAAVLAWLWSRRNDIAEELTLEKGDVMYKRANARTSQWDALV